MPKNPRYISNPVFIACSLLLILNDHYLKYEFGNWFTGKLSDIAGIIILPLIIAFIFPRVQRFSIWITAILFVFWKSEFSDFAINAYNDYSFMQTSRVVDYTDLFVLPLLVVPEYIIRNGDLKYFRPIRINHRLILIPTLVALVATSPPPSHYYTMTEGNLRCYKCHITVKYNQEEILLKLKDIGIVFDSVVTSDKYPLTMVKNSSKRNINLYHMNRLIIEKDTFQNLDITMMTINDRKTKIFFNGIQISQDIPTFKVEKKLRKYYRDILFKEMRKTLVK